MEHMNPQRGAFEAPELHQLTGDERSIRLGIEAARAADREVDDATARLIASQVHGGQASALYSLASTGNLADDRLEGELRELYQSRDPRVRDWASVLGTYALHREHRGLVDGWATLWAEPGHPTADTRPPATAPTPEDDEAQARADLMHRLNSAAVRTLGQVATIFGAEGVSGLGAQEREEDETDAYPWSDAVRRRPDGLGPDELSAPSVGGVSRDAVEELFTRLPDAQLGSREDMGWCGLVRHEGRAGGVILHENQYGRRWAWTTDTDETLEHRWQQLEDEHDAYQGAAGAAEGNRDVSPRIWVGSLADYTAGYPHGTWLDATSVPEELAAAVQFMLRNSHEPDAEEYGVFDYDGFGSEVPRLLGEYPSLETVAKIAQGIYEHGQAFAAWAAYVGPEQTEQLDRFEDHYLGEWDSLEAYTEDLLRDTEAYRVIEEAPEALRPYLTLDVEAYARDLECELHVVEKPDSGVWLFDTHA
jgi:antirestriction protein